MRSSTVLSKWREHTAKVRTALGVSASYAPWSSKVCTDEVRLVGILTNAHRMIDILDVGWATRVMSLKAANNGQHVPTAQARKQYWANASQVVQRSPSKTKMQKALLAQTRSYLADTKLWHEAADPRDHMWAPLWAKAQTFM